MNVSDHCARYPDGNTFTECAAAPKNKTPNLGLGICYWCAESIPCKIPPHFG